MKRNLYNEGAEYYFKKAIEIDPQYANAYVNFSSFLIKRTNSMDSKISTSDIDKKRIEDLKWQKAQMMKSVQFYLDKAVVIDPFNSHAKQLIASINNTSTVKTKAFAGE